MSAEESVVEVDYDEPSEVDTTTDPDVHVTREIDDVNLEDDPLEALRGMGVDPESAEQVAAATERAKANRETTIAKKKAAPQPEAEEPEEEEAPAEAKAEEADNPEKEIKEPWGRIRHLEKARNAKEDEIGMLRGRMDKLTAAIERLATKGVEAENANAQPEDEEIDPEQDPAGALLQEVRKVQSRLDEMEGRSKAQQQAELVVDALQRVDSNLHREVAKADSQNERERIEGMVFKGAFAHVAQSLDRAMAKRFPELSVQERIAIARDQTNLTKLQWEAQGLDPVAEFYDLAAISGFDPYAYKEQVVASLKQPAPQAKSPAAPEKPKKSAKDEVDKARQRQQSAGGIGGVQGARPAKSIAKALSEAKTDEEFEATLQQAIKQGEMQPDSTSLAGTPPFSQLLAGKGVRMS